MYADPRATEKRTLLKEWASKVFYALDDPKFNGSHPVSQNEFNATGQRSRDPIRLDARDGKRGAMSHSTAGPRACVLEISAGLDGTRLKRAMEKSDFANCRALVPWNFDGDPQVHFPGKRLRIEVAWPRHLQASDIPLCALEPQPTRGNCAVLGYSSRGITITLRMDNKLFSSVLLGGTTGSGKSTLLQLMCAQLSRDPKAQHILLDGKSGQGLAVLNGIQGQIGPLALKAHQVRNALGYAYRVMEERNARYQFEEEPEHLARPLYIWFDEFDSFTTSDPVVARLTYLLVKQGRTARVHLIYATQSPKQGNFGKEKGSRGQFNIRLGLLVRGYEESAAIIGYNTPRADLLQGAGDTLFVAPGISERLQAAYLTAAELRAHTGGQPALSEWPQFDASVLNNDEQKTRAQPFNVEESLLATFAAQHGWGKCKTLRVMREVLGYGMGSERVEERLLPRGKELAALWNQIGEAV